MALRNFETKDAVYYLGMGMHIISSEPIFRRINFSTIDFIVFEDNGIDHFLENIIDSNVQYKSLYKRVVEDNPKIKIYGIESYQNQLLMLGSMGLEGLITAYGIKFVYDAYKGFKRKDSSRREFLKNLGKAASGTIIVSAMPQIINGITKDKSLPLVSEINSLKSSILPTPVIGLRDAIVAKKIEEYLVPLNKPKDRKANVAIIYGAMHSGLETKIKRPWLRDATIWLYHDLLRHMEKSDLNTICEIKRSECGNTWSEYSSCELFK